MLFGWKVVKHVKSNAIVYVSAGPHIGRRRWPNEPRGFEPNRGLESGRSRIFAAGQRGLQRRVLPFPGWLVAAAQAGATAAIQPGGSVRDAEVIAAADAHNVAMVFTGVRHFRH